MAAGLLAGSAGAGTLEQAGLSRVLATCPVSTRYETDPSSGGLRALRATRIPLPAAATAAEAVRAWALAHRDAFGLRDEDDLAVSEQGPLGGGRTRVRLVQRWHGADVDGATALAMVAPDGTLEYLAATFAPGIAAPAAADVPRAAALAAAATDAGLDLRAGGADARLAVLRAAGGDHLAWRVAWANAVDGGRTVWVDANDGRILRRDLPLTHALGLVYPTDPSGALAEVPLLRLSGDGSRLVSRLAGVDDHSGPDLVEPTGDFRIPPSDSAFDQVNAYWHVDHYLHDVLGALGYGGPPESLIVGVRVPLDPNVALTNGRYVLFGLPIGNITRDASLGDDIVYHESQHGVTYGYGIQPTSLHREALAIHEGVSDYFAAVATGDPAIGEYVYLPYPSGATRVDLPATTFNYSHYDHVTYGAAPYGSGWANGMILSGALWDLRGAIGASADSLVLQALSLLPTNPEFDVFANAVVQADLSWHGGAHTSAIVAAFTRRGIHGATLALFTAIQGPLVARPGVPTTFVAADCCAGLPGTYRWFVQPYCRDVPCAGGWRPAGDGPTATLTFDGDAIVRLEVSSAWGDTVVDQRFVSVTPPRLLVLGPTRTAQRVPATWRAYATGVDVRVSWTRTYRRPYAPVEQLPTGSEQTFAPDTSLVLAVRTGDAFGRTADTTLDVRTLSSPAPAVRAASFGLTLRASPGGRQEEVRLDLPTPGPTRLAVYDVRGREVARLVDGFEPAGTRSLRWDTAAIAPGIYFARAVHAGEALDARFVVVR